VAAAALRNIGDVESLLQLALCRLIHTQSTDVALTLASGRVLLKDGIMDIIAERSRGMKGV
jgi:hypothetical protein